VYSAAAAIITKCAHSSPERARQLRCTVPQQPSSPSAHTAPRAHASSPAWGAEAAPHHQARTQLPSSRACDMSGITDHAPPLRASRACDMSGFTDHAPPLRVTILRVQLLRHRRVRTTATSSMACDMSGITNHAPPFRVTDSTGHREVRVVFLATELPHAGTESVSFAGGLRMTVRVVSFACGLRLTVRMLLFAGRLRRRFEWFRSQLDNQGCAVGAPVAITSLGNGVSSREIAFSGNNLEGALSGKEWSYVLLHER
jgi:hypothetical protein